MSLKPEFQFSQSSLQDYIDCQRRFELRYILHLEWPALESEPVIEQERHMELGHRFHRLAQQYALNLPEKMLDQQASDPDLCRWWQNFRHSDPLASLTGVKRPEYTLAMPFCGYRLLAKYDLVAVDPGNKAIILDWKTSRKRQPASFLRKRIQTRLYLFLLVSAGARLNNNTLLLPEQVEMTYWFPEFPEHPETFSYSAKTYTDDRDFLSGMVEEIACRKEGQFFLTEDEKKCLFCPYRSLCNRGCEAGRLDPDQFDEAEDGSTSGKTPAIEISFDDIGEIAF